MTKQTRFIHRSMRACFSLLAFITAGAAACAQATDFSGVWKQDNDRCHPKRSGHVTLRIEHHDRELTVETSILRGSQSSRHALQKYTTDGQVSVPTGADGDEFHATVVWKDASLVFVIEEHEDGRVLYSSETWSLIENGETLKRIRDRRDGGEQVAYFRGQRARSG